MAAAADLAARRWLVLASAMLSFFAVGVTFFAVPPLLGELRALLGLSNLQVGVLMGAIAFPAIVLSLPLGSAVDRWPPRRAGLAGLAMMAAGAALFAAAPGYGWLLAGRLLFGIGGLVLNLLLARLVSAAFAGRELALAMALFTGVYPASMILMFSLHPVLLARLGWRGELGALALLVLAAVPLHLAAIPARLEPHARASTQAPSGWGWLGRPLLALGAAWMLYFAAFASVLTFGPQWTGGDSRGLLIVSVITWVALVLTPVAGALIDRLGAAHVWCACALLLLTVELLAMAAGIAPLLAMLGVGLAAAVAPPAVYSLPARLVPGDRVGSAFGFITALSNLGTVLGPAAAGAIRDATPSWPVLWLVLAGCALAGALAATAAGARRAT